MTISENAGTPEARDVAPRPTVAQLAARWPSLAGVAMVGVLAALGLQTHLTAMIIMIAALSFLLTAAIGRPRGAWIVLPVIVAVATIGMMTFLDAIVLLLALAMAGVAFGLLHRVRPDWRQLGLQSAGFVVFAGVGLGAMMVAPLPAALLVGVTALAHGGWSVVHLRRSSVVARSYAEFLAVVDFGLGAVTLIMAFSGWGVA